MNAVCGRNLICLMRFTAVMGMAASCASGIGLKAAAFPTRQDVFVQSGSAQVSPQSTPAQPPNDGPSGGSDDRGRRMRGMGGLPGGARGMLGSVTGVAADHYTIKTDSGEAYTVHFSANTRIMRQPEGQLGRHRQNGGGNEAAPSSTGSGSPDGNSNERDRPAPQTIKPTDIKIGDVITAAGEVDAANKSIGAIFIAQVDPERAKQMREMEANYGKTWLAGRITSVDGTRITIDGMIDHAPHAIEVDDNTSFRERRDSITLADVKPGGQLRAEGAMRSGVFLATVVNAMPPRDREAEKP